MKLVVITGLSGSGKSIALHTLEDEDYYCVDNLHLGLLNALVTLLTDASHRAIRKVAVGVDARTTTAADLDRFAEILDQLRQSGMEVQTVFLEADEPTLIKRYSETRRRHPLSHKGLSLVDAIHHERRLLAEVSARVNLRIDTTNTTIHQLRAIIRERVCAGSSTGLSLLFQSFGYKHGIPPDSDFVFDSRCLPNPHWEPSLRSLTGLDEPVRDYLASQPQVEEMYRMICDYIGFWTPQFESENRSYLTVSVGCTGGQHRSVYLIERLSAYFREARGDRILTRHRDIVPTSR